ncbi:hypothetical protein EEPDABAO_00090 [Klebsiella phage mfs]|uniref:Uncharacterized protein n=1 Tax=Klebsiella phage mfs TaxID=2985561 RepID=A0A9X9P1B5_9CAUD|nr:hypothetical protein EEPDABAO_00090 [Klebsiella phage mfs]
MPTNRSWTTLYLDVQLDFVMPLAHLTLLPLIINPANLPCTDHHLPGF